MHIREIPQTDTATIDAYVDAHPRGSLYHGSRWLALVERVFGHAVQVFGAYDADGTLHGVVPMVRLSSTLFGHYAVSLPFVNFGGAIGDDEEIENALIDAAAQFTAAHGCTHLELRDDIPRDTPLACRTDKVLMELALPDDADALFKALGTKLRAQVRRPLREGATVHRGGADLLDEFYAVFARNMRDLGTPVYSRRLFAEFIAT